MSPGGGGQYFPLTPPTPPTREEIEDFIRRLEAAKAQDEAEGNADCGTEEKKAALIEAVNRLSEQFQELQSELQELVDVVNNL